MLPRADHDMIDMIGFGELQDRGRGIDGLQHVNRQPAVVELQRLRPMLERDQPIDVLVVALVIERAVDGDAAEFEDIQAGQSRRWQDPENAVDGYPQRLVQFARAFRGVERDR